MTRSKSPGVAYFVIAVLCLVGGSLIWVGCEGLGPPKTLEMVIWHTELDPDAEQLILETAREVEDEFAESSEEYVPVLSVSGLAWGDVARRLFQQHDNPPDITHLQPFMVYQVLREYSDPAGYSLHPLDKLIKKLEADNGPIEGAVKTLHRYRVGPEQQPATFGLAYAVGTTFIAYREDWNGQSETQPETWDELIRFADHLADTGSDQNGHEIPAFILPGKSPFFIDQLTNEIVVSLGGSLYHEGRPNFDTDELRKALYLLQSMIARTDGRYSTTTYRQQFDMLAKGEGAVVPVTYGRATKQIDNVLEKRASSSDEIQRLRRNFQVMPQPGPDHGTPGVATIDAEPWVIIARPDRSDDHPQRELRLAIAERFLERFYEKSRYLEFCSQVPVHLRPVFENLAEPYDEKPDQQDWWHWVEVGKQMLARPHGTAPILMDVERGGSRPVKFALSLQRNSVISDMVLEAYEPVRGLLRSTNGQDDSEIRARREEAIEEAIRRASIRAEDLYDAAD